jgi:hypothetical protein
MLSKHCRCIASRLSAPGPPAAYSAATTLGDAHEGYVRAGGIEKDVTFVDADLRVNDDLDAEYSAKYRRYRARFVDAVVSAEARATTLKLVPRLGNLYGGGCQRCRDATAADRMAAIGAETRRPDACLNALQATRRAEVRLDSSGGPRATE